MATCPHCGEDRMEHARFCWSCGGALTGDADAGREVRKTVTVLFCDLVGSTALGERRDPEQLRRIISQYFDMVSASLGRYGGTVEKFIGDAVMAVFGMPLSHEDDALLAVLAGDEIRRGLDALNADLAHALGAPLQVRIGLNTGEVVAGDRGRGDFYVTGDAVNAAERLERNADPGGILLGGETYRLARHGIRAEPIPDLQVKGKADALTAYRLLEVLPGTASRPPTLTSPLIGRDTERLLLESALSRCISNRACQLFTLLGPPGVGKSRLASEALGSYRDQARVLVVSCIRHGGAATFWPVAELIRQAIEVDDGAPEEDYRAAVAKALGGEPEAALIAGRLLEILGVSQSSPISEGSFWAVRKLLEAPALERPLVVVVDDVGWADSTSLDLIEDVADWSRDAPILLVCLARPELVDARPSWGGGKLNATTVFLDPLPATEAARLLDNLLESAPSAAGLRGRILEVSGGNPLFIEEMLARLIDDGILFRREGRWEAADAAAEVPLPTTIQVLLESRLDALAVPHRRLLEEAAVEGKVFHRGAIEVLATPERRDGLDRDIAALVRAELIRADRPAFDGERAYRFRHPLIREVAYESIPKAARAALHERFAEWLELRTSGRGIHLDEIAGHHLERAFGYRSELERPDAALLELAAKAAERLATAGRSALSRGDANAAAGLLHRSTGLFEAAGAPQADVLLDLGSALSESGDFFAAEEVLQAALGAATAAGAETVAAHALIELSQERMLVDAGTDVGEMLDVANEAIAVFERAGDETGLSRAWRHVAQAHWTRCRCAEMEEVLERALVHAERAGDQRERSRILSGLARATVIGPRPVEAGIPRCHAILERADDDVALAAVADAMLAVLEGMRCQFDVAREHWQRAERRLEDVGLNTMLAALRMYPAIFELMAGRAEEAEAVAASAYSELERIGDRGRLPTAAAVLARAVFDQGRYDEAERYTRIAEEAALGDDVVSQVMWRGTRSKVLARTGEARHAEELAHAGVDRSQETDFLLLQADALTDLADVLAVLGRPDEAAGPLRRATGIRARKGILVHGRTQPRPAAAAARAGLDTAASPQV